MKFIIVTYYGRGPAQRAWSGKRWISDVSVAEEYDTEAKACIAFHIVAGRANLRHRDRAVVIEDYGLVTERVVYHLDADGCVVATPENMPTKEPLACSTCSTCGRTDYTQCTAGAFCPHNARANGDE